MLRAVVGRDVVLTWNFWGVGGKRSSKVDLSQLMFLEDKGERCGDGPDGNGNEATVQLR